MTRALMFVALLAACQSDKPEPTPAAQVVAPKVSPTCADMARRGVELALADPSAPAEMREQLAATREQAIAGGTAQCEQLKPPPAVLACMIAAKTYEEYAACGRSFTPD